MSLDLRKMRILQAIIDDYITTAAPIGSRTISKRSDIGLSSATIRNEMFDLKELGFLEQPHTSAGSLPSEKAYRLYVNSIMQQSALNSEEIAYINSHVSRQFASIKDIVKQTAVVMSQMTNCMSMVLTPQVSDIKLKRISLIQVSDDRALLIIVTDAGLLRNTFITVPQGMDSQMLDRLSVMLTERLQNRKLRDISDSAIFDVFEEFGERKETLRVMQSFVEAIKNADVKEGREVELTGATNLLSFPEYSDIEKARQLLATVEKRDVLRTILDNATNLEFSITIGSENEDPSMQDCSIVTATYKIDDMPIGSLGVLGPIRMDYSKTLAVLRYIGQSLSEILTDMYHKNDKDT